MSKPAKGEVRWANGRATARITLKGKDRETYELSSCRTAPEAEERSRLLAEMAQRFRKAGIISTPEARKLLQTAASCPPKLIPSVLQVAGELAGGELIKTATVPSFGSLAKDWTDGTLHEKYPDHVKAKDSDLDESRLKKINAIDVGHGLKHGDVPLDRYTLDHALEVMRNLPQEAKRPGTRRAYAILINRVLNLAVYPCRIIERNPLPKGFVPSAGKPPAFPYLYPTEDAALLHCKTVPLARRMLFGFLAREGCRFGEAVNLTFDDLNLKLGTVSLDENKTDDPRTWALNPHVAKALAAWQKHRKAGTKEPVFVDEHGRPLVAGNSLVDELRGDLEAAEVKRKELLVPGVNRGVVRVHDLRGTFVTLSLANGRTETWVADRTGHKSSQMINRYRRAARGAGELGLGELIPLSEVPELKAYEDFDSPRIAPQSLGNESAGGSSSGNSAVGHDRLELSANGLRVRCSTN